MGQRVCVPGKGEGCDVIVEAFRVVEHPLRQVVETTVQICAYAGSGNVLQIQILLSIVGEHIEEGKGAHQVSGLTDGDLTIFLTGDRLSLASASLRSRLLRSSVPTWRCARSTTSFSIVK
jgi:26S proteasome regulatory subunit N1